MTSSLERLEEHLEAYFSDIDGIEQDIPGAAPIISKIKALRQIEDEKTMRAAAADLVTSMGNRETLNFLSAEKVMALATVIEMTAGILVMYIRAKAKEQVTSAPVRVLH